MVDSLNRSWWFFILRGFVAVLFGILAFIWPGITLASLILLFGAYALVNGVFALVAAAKAPKGSNGRGATVFLGLLSVTAGLLTFFYPGLTVISLLAVIAAWAIITGIFEIIAAIQLRRLIKGGWMLLLSGVVSIVFGVLLILMPGAGILSLIWLIGAYAILFGALLMASAIWLKSAAPLQVAPAT